MKELAQVIAGLRLGRIGPKKEAKMLALLGNTTMQHQIGEQGLQARGSKGSHLLVVVMQVETAKQADVQNWLHVDLLTSRQVIPRSPRAAPPYSRPRTPLEAANRHQAALRLRSTHIGAAAGRPVARDVYIALSHDQDMLRLAA